MNFSTSILNGAIVLGTLCTSVAFIYFIYIFVKTLVQGKDMPGYASLACLILFFGGIIIINLGISTAFNLSYSPNTTWIFLLKRSSLLK